jgi:methyl-accepting chemotaxis protein
VAAGDLSSRIELRTQDETGQRMAAPSGMNGSLRDIVGKVRHGTTSIASASTRIASGNQDLSSRTEVQSSSLEQTTFAMKELTDIVRANRATTPTGPASWPRRPPACSAFGKKETSVDAVIAATGPR